jgi:hypothetical protein
MKSVNRTFRLEEDLLTTVRETALRKNVSMNEFVADALREASADAVLEGLQMEEVPGAWLQKLMEYVPAASIPELGRWATMNFTRKFVWETFKEISPDALIRAYEILAKKYKNIISFEHLKEGPEHTLKLSHSRGQKWSALYAENIRSGFKDLLGIELKLEWGPSEIIGKYTEPRTSMVKNRPVPQTAG